VHIGSAIHGYDPMLGIMHCERDRLAGFRVRPDGAGAAEARSGSPCVSQIGGVAPCRFHEPSGWGGEAQSRASKEIVFFCRIIALEKPGGSPRSVTSIPIHLSGREFENESLTWASPNAALREKRELVGRPCAKFWPTIPHRDMVVRSHQRPRAERLR
jgi:hypothetical protein